MKARPPFTIGHAEVAPGSRLTVDLPVSVLSDHTPVTMSAHVVHGRRDGPVIFVSGGVHGNEVIGVEIVRRLLRTPNLAVLKGTLIAVPIVNAFGFISRSRYLPDRRDLNRVFPGSEHGSLASRLAHLFMTEIVARSDLGIDLHSAAIHRTNFPQIRIPPGNPRARDLAGVFGPPIVMRSALREGSLRSAAMEMGKDVLLYEAGEGLRFDELSVRAGLAGILRVMRHMGMLPAKGISKPKTPPQFCSSSKWLRAPMGGLLRVYKADGGLVRQGELMGSVSDPFGEEDQEILAPFDGLIVGRAMMPVVNEGDAVFNLGSIRSFERAGDTVEDLSTQLEDDPMFDEDEII
ncbi:succinylglutamate desuccinylase/aspartoacylase family protein [Leisingera thetidis]|uniref:succinylglutamate desuccinylase/aspartoacylase family protein n=1 Tax=Leisingera thetidis TaxID=2930199 RepID=UPI0021F7505C|nr:succinylglutamate desuccinylase/aspartoacylase family protein [Leisingera thetidis]